MGKISDKFLGAFNLKEGDEYDEEYDGEFEEGYEDEYDDYDDGYDDYEDEPKKEGGFFKKKEQHPGEEKQSVFSRMTSGRPQVRTAKAGNQEVCIFKPSSIEDSREITETLLDGKAVVINFEGLHVEISQRIIDFISGSCYALDGNLQKVSNYIFIATPSTIDISGDFQDLLATDDSTFDISGFKSPLL